MASEECPTLNWGIGGFSTSKCGVEGGMARAPQLATLEVRGLADADILDLHTQRKLERYSLH